MYHLLAALMPKSAASLTLTPLGTASSTSDGTTYNFGNFNAPTNGLMIVVFTANGGNARTVSSISIGGTNGGLVGPADSDNLKGAIGYREISAGNNAVSVTLSGTNGASGASLEVSVWLLTGYTSPTPTASHAPAKSAGTSASATFNLSDNGIALYGLVKATTGAVAWTSADDSALDADLNSRHHAHAVINPTVAETSHVETASWSSSGGCRIIGAAWR